MSAIEIEMADDYVREARTGTGQPYSRNWRVMLRRWWLDGWDGNRLPAKESNYEVPLRDAYGAGQFARQATP